MQTPTPLFAVILVDTIVKLVNRWLLRSIVKSVYGEIGDWILHLEQMSAAFVVHTKTKNRAE